VTTSRGVALITGAPRRIGRVLALAAAEAGYDVAVHARALDEDARSLADAVDSLGRHSVLMQADLADPHAPTDLIAWAQDALGPLTLLVNNASLFEDDRIDSLTAESWSAHMNTNLRTPIFLAQAFAAQAPAGSLIVNILDQRVLRPTPQFFSYALSKAALWEATRMMAQGLAPRVRVNGIGPGPTLPSIHQSAAEFAAEAANIPLQRRATPDEIAQALRYLIDARSVTGQMIAVDGGQHLGWRTPDILAP
jgi:NAD(P)-dependent dehydrogenase (short-subunit alcohol dehydrogenase family)